jgi:hypothetical protein
MCFALELPGFVPVSMSMTAQIDEALSKVLCYDLCVLIQSVHELGIEAGSDVTKRSPQAGSEGSRSHSCVVSGGVGHRLFLSTPTTQE